MKRTSVISIALVLQLSVFGSSHLQAQRLGGGAMALPSMR
jgi:hypothetical protein